MSSDFAKYSERLRHKIRSRHKKAMPNYQHPEPKCKTYYSPPPTPKPQ